MELTKYDVKAKANEGAWLTLRTPGKKSELTDARIKLAGSDSDLWEEAMERFYDKRLKKMQAGNTDLESKELKEARLRTLAHVTLEWENIEEHKKPYPCSEHNALVLYRKYPFIREQVDEFIVDRDNYLNTPEQYMAEVEKKSESGESGDSGSSLAA